MQVIHDKNGQVRLRNPSIDYTVPAEDLELARLILAEHPDPWAARFVVSRQFQDHYGSLLKGRAVVLAALKTMRIKENP